MNRAEMLSRVTGRKEPWDMLIIGGGATGIGIALDAASRGYQALLLDQSDFGKGTSSRSTKLVHGGVRYLQQGNVSLVMEALKERGILRRNAPHLVSDLRFIVPNYDWWETPFYGIGLKVYDLLAGKYGFGPSRLLNKEQTIGYLPTIKTDGLRGGVQYFDGQFDDSRLLISLARTAAAQGAVLLNYCKVTRLLKQADGFLNGVIALDTESNTEHEVHARVVINAAGPFVDSVLRLDQPDLRPMIAPSQGIHLVLDKTFLPGDSAIMVPHTRDGRVMFAIPWHGHTLVGTTDTPIQEISLEPVPLREEVDFILETAANYLQRAPTRSDVLSAFAGIRPLVRAREVENTAALSRDHTIHISNSGLLTICGGKWTTYRRMAEDAVDHAATLARLDERPCRTKALRIHGYTESAVSPSPLSLYGTDAAAIQDLIGAGAARPRHLETVERARAAPVPLGNPLHPALPYTGAEVVWACRMEMARTVDDVLSRRTRALVLNARAALAAAPNIAALMSRELGRDDAWAQEQIKAFQQIAINYILSSAAEPG